MVITSHGNERQKVTYDQLAQKLSAADLQYIKTRERVMDMLYRQWESGYLAIPPEMDPIRRAQLEQRLDGVTGDLGRELGIILGFVEKSGLHLDDHYMIFRSLAGGP